MQTLRWEGKMQKMGRCKRCGNGENSGTWVVNKEEKQ